ncbi:MAG: hypothetical protein V1744_02350 [Candidatus Altiarchaeota archaeon]
MRKITKFGIGIIVVVVVVAGLWMYHTHGLYENTYSSEYGYRVTIGTDSVLHNITLYLPLPVLGEKSEVGGEINAGNALKSDGWDCSIVETEYGKMLKISAKKMVPEFYSFPMLLEPGEKPKEQISGKISDTSSKETPVLMPKELSVRVRADHDINTKNPIGNEPLLSPKYNLTRSTYELPYLKGRTPPNYYEYESRIYADYATSANANVSIYIETEGRNSWWVYGWSGNNYRDRIELTFTGEQHGWYVASGKLVEGEGRYGWM